MIKYFDSMKVRRKTTVSDGMGGLTPTWSTVFGLSDIECRSRQLKAEELVINDKMSVEYTDKVYCSDISLLVSDVLWITQRGETSSEVFEVKSFDRKRNVGSGNIVHMEIRAKKIA